MVDMGESTNLTSVSGDWCVLITTCIRLGSGMPAPPATPTNFRQILELVWWRLDMALDLDIIRDSARLGALEALAEVAPQSSTTMNHLMRSRVRSTHCRGM